MYRISGGLPTQLTPAPKAAPGVRVLLCMKIVNAKLFSPLTWNCSVSDPFLMEGTPDATRVALWPTCPGPKFAQPRPSPDGGLLQGQGSVPFCPGSQRTVNCARAGEAIPNRIPAQE